METSRFTQLQEHYPPTPNILCKTFNYLRYRFVRYYIVLADWTISRRCLKCTGSSVLHDHERVFQCYPKCYLDFP